MNPVRWPERTAEVAFFGALAPTLFAVLAFGGVYSWAWAGADLALFAATLLVLVLAWRARLGLEFNVVVVPAALFWLLGLGQWLGHSSVDRAATLTQLIQLAGNGCALLLALVAFRQARNLKRLGWALWGFTALLAGEAILQALTAHDRIYWFHDASYATPVGPFVYHNHFAGCLCLLLPVTAAIAFRSTRQRKADWITWLRRALVPGVAGVALVLSLSRGGVLCLAAQGLLAMAMFIRRPTRVLRPLLLIALLSGGLIALTNWGAMRSRFELLDQKDASVTDRLRVSATCVQIFRHFPVVGAGMGSFPAIYPAFESFDLGARFEQAHDEYAQTLAESGSLGMLLVLAVLWLWVEAGRRLRRAGSGYLPSTVQAAAWVSAAGLLLYSSWDFQFHSPGNGLLFFVLLGAALSPVARASRQAAPAVAGRREGRANRSGAPAPVPIRSGAPEVR